MELRKPNGTFLDVDTESHVLLVGPFSKDFTSTEDPAMGEDWRCNFLAGSRGWFNEINREVLATRLVAERGGLVRT